MGHINQDANLYNKKGQLLHKTGEYPKDMAPLKGNMDVMYVGMAKHRKNTKTNK